MKLKLDLHPIFFRGDRIEAALLAIIDEACDKRAAEIEIIPGKGSGALKKTVLRFLDRPEIKSRYHRVEKDSDNWGRVFVHFRWDRADKVSKGGAPEAELADAACFACGATIRVGADALGAEIGAQIVVACDCQSCASPNRVAVRRRRGGMADASSQSGYE